MVALFRVSYLPEIEIHFCRLTWGHFGRLTCLRAGTVFSVNKAHMILCMQNIRRVLCFSNCQIQNKSKSLVFFFPFVMLFVVEGHTINLRLTDAQSVKYLLPLM